MYKNIVIKWSVKHSSSLLNAGKNEEENLQHRHVNTDIKILLSQYIMYIWGAATYV
jgi:hypothetical protein